MESQERRMFDRFDVDFTAEIRGPSKNEFCQCCNVSAQGAGVYTEERLTPQTKLELLLGIPNGHRPFHGLARVVWSNQVQEDKWRSGLEFEKVDFMGIRRIFETLAKKG